MITPTSTVTQASPVVVVSKADPLSQQNRSLHQQQTTIVQPQYAFASSDGFASNFQPTTLEALGPMDGSKVIIHHPMPYLPPPPKEGDPTVYYHNEGENLHPQSQAPAAC